ncbi:hypothetical protein E3T20_12185 [Cryobacterium sp. TmT3-12]|nr:hypothetical protein E3T20_12185 [Cryobacterium sp. TmT3-12]
MIRLSPFARLFYIGLWNFAYCDKGHLPDDALGLKLKILPADPVDADELLAEVMRNGRVSRVEAEGKTYLWMPSFGPWQKTDPRWKTRCPACAHQDSLILTKTPVSYAESHQSSALREENQREEKRTVITHALPSAESVFDAAYLHWPKKVERKAALEKFKAAAKRIDSEALAAHIVRFGDAYAATTDKRFTPALGVWIGHERWTDELPSAQQGERKPTRTDQNLDFVAQLAREQAQQQRGLTA